MQAYISINFSKRKQFEYVVKAISKTLTTHNISPFVFVDQYNFAISQEKEMLENVMKDIKSSVILIAETSEKGIGIGVEVGYAKALGKPVIYLRNQLAEHSTTVAGISDYQLIYKDEDDLIDQLQQILAKIQI